MLIHKYFKIEAQRADLKNLKQFAASHYQDLTNNFLLGSTIQAFKCDRQCVSLTSNGKESNLLENITGDHKISIQTKFICRHVHISSLCSGAIPPFEPEP